MKIHIAVCWIMPSCSLVRGHQTWRWRQHVPPKQCPVPIQLQRRPSYKNINKSIIIFFQENYFLCCIPHHSDVTQEAQLNNTAGDTIWQFTCKWKVEGNNHTLPHFLRH